MRVAIIGCGYTGRVLTRRLVASGREVLATTTTGANLAHVKALGAEPVLLRADDPVESLARGMRGADAVVYLAPPPSKQDAGAKADINTIAGNLADACPDTVRSFVYGSTSGVFGQRSSPSGVDPRDEIAWVDERTPIGLPNPRGQRRLDTEQALARAGLPLKVARIVGIYGPGRTLRSALERESLILFAGAPVTSRIHVQDLARILEAMTAPDSPDLVVACDDGPATTLDVARYTAELLGTSAPEPIPIEDARRLMSPIALQMRLGGHRCRSIHRADLIGALEHPTYREGVRASLQAEGAIP